MASREQHYPRCAACRAELGPLAEREPRSGEHLCVDCSPAERIYFPIPERHPEADQGVKRD